MRGTISNNRKFIATCKLRCVFVCVCMQSQCTLFISLANKILQVIAQANFVPKNTTSDNGEVNENVKQKKTKKNKTKTKNDMANDCVMSTHLSDDAWCFECKAKSINQNSHETNSNVHVTHPFRAKTCRAAPKVRMYIYRERERVKRETNLNADNLIWVSVDGGVFWCGRFLLKRLIALKCDTKPVHPIVWSLSGN